MLRVCISTAVFLSCCILTAQTAGSLAPEVLKFEPVDGTELVHRPTGDFTYSVPVLSIPGAPGGSFPLNLSYHSGVGYQEEASWVGLGWNLTTGQVTRAVRGFADDYRRVDLQHGPYDVAGPSQIRALVAAEFSSAGTRHQYFMNYDPIQFDHRFAKLSGSDKLHYLGRRLHTIDPPSIFHLSFPATIQGQPSTKSAAYGYIYLPEVRDEIDQPTSSPDDPLSKSIESLDLFLDISVRDDDRALWDFIGNTPDTDYQEVYQRKASWLADRAEGDIDFYTVAVEGLGGRIRPIHQKRGWLIPTDSVSRGEIEGDPDRRVFPYRYIFDLLRNGLIEGYTNLFNGSDQGWAAVDAIPEEPVEDPYAGSNMVFLDDPGFLTDQKLYTEIDSNTSGDVFFGDHSQLKNTSKKVRYETDIDGKIIQIIVVREDGRRYIFGLHGALEATGDTRPYGYLYGAAPRVTWTKRWSQTRIPGGAATGSSHVELVGPTYDEDETLQTDVNTQGAAYAYAWSLAAIESPDYRDSNGNGRYDPEDKGTYIYFTYKTASPVYQWQTPWSDDPVNQPQYYLAGYSGAQNRREVHERIEGAKVIAYPHLAVTRTHVAVFDTSERSDALPAPGSESTLNYALTDRQLGPRQIHAGSTASKIVFAGTEHDMLDNSCVPILLPLDYAVRNGLDEEGASLPCIAEGVTPMPNGQPGDIMTFGPTGLMVHLLKAYPEIDTALCFVKGVRPLINPGSISRTHFQRFVLNQDMPVKHGMLRLDRVRLYTYDYYQQAMDSQQGVFDARFLEEDSGYLRKVSFSFASGFSDDHLTPGKPNVAQGAPSGSLTLKGLSLSTRGDVSTGNPYTFGYHYYQPTTTSLPFHRRKDPWGFYSAASTDEQLVVDSSTIAGGNGRDQPIQAAWSLASITTPMGTRIEIDYESDRYAFVQDRLAVKLENKASEVQTKAAHLNNSDPPQVTYSLSPLIAPSELSGPQTLNSLRSLLEGKPIDTSNHWPDHVVLAAGYSIAGEAYSRQFVVPVTSDQNGTHLVMCGALEEVISWLHLVGVELEPSQGDRPEVDFLFLDYYPIEGSNTTPSTANAIRFGGGIRVSKLTMKELSGGGSYALEYFYTDPDSIEIPESNDPLAVPTEPLDLTAGLESGVVFYEPLVTTGSAGDPVVDNRIIRPEEQAYDGMGGTDVHYKHTTVRYVGSEGDDSSVASRALDTREIITAADERVHSPFADSGVTGDIYGFDRVHSESLLDNSGALFEMPVLDQGNIPTGDTYQANFSIDRDIRKIVLDNTALIGQPKRQRILDAFSGRELTATEFTYGAAYLPGTDQGSGGFSLQSWSVDSNGQLSGVDNPGQETNPYAQGAHFDKNQALLLAWDWGESTSHYRGKVLMLDRIHNVFRPGVMRKKHNYFGQQSTEALETVEEVLAYDFHTGLPSLTRATLSPIEYEIGLTIPAHQLFVWEPGAEAQSPPVEISPDRSLKGLNMLVQKGLSLTAEHAAPLVFGEILDHLTHDPDETSNPIVKRVQLRHWRRPAADSDAYVNAGLVPPSETAWVPFADYAFVHQSEEKTSNGWKTLPIAIDNGMLAIDVPSTPTDGQWRLEGQNTLFSERLAVLENITRRGIASAVIMTEIHGTRLPAAVFSNARRDQVFYQGFEGGDPDLVDAPAPVIHPDDNLGDGHLDTTLHYLRRFKSIEAGTQVVYAGGGAQPLDAGNDFTIDANMNGPAYLSFYAALIGAEKPEGALTLVYTPIIEGVPSSETTSDIDLSASRTSDLTVTPVDNGWFLIRHHFDTAVTELSITSSAQVTIDEITVYPAAVGVDGVDATATLTAYHPVWKKPISITDIRGRTQRFEYNLRGELFRVYDIDGGLLREHFRAEQGDSLAAPEAYQTGQND